MEKAQIGNPVCNVPFLTAGSTQCCFTISILLSGAMIMTIWYVITGDIGINSIHKYIYLDANIVCVKSCSVNEL